ncbi:MAG: PadR family transcriptional regulator [Betaproteobacteria bacterium]
MLRVVHLAFARVHVLHHAAEAPIFGLAMMEELKRHGYDISAGTMYPLLHALETAGALVSTGEVVNGKIRKYYRTTKSGDVLLRELRGNIGELVEEVLEEHPHTKTSKRTKR